MDSCPTRKTISTENIFELPQTRTDNATMGSDAYRGAAGLSLGDQASLAHCSWMRHSGRGAVAVAFGAGLLLMFVSFTSITVGFLPAFSGGSHSQVYPRAELRGTPTMDKWLLEHQEQIRRSNVKATGGEGGASLVFLGDSITQGWQFGWRRLTDSKPYTLYTPLPLNSKP